MDTLREMVRRLINEVEVKTSLHYDICKDSRLVELNQTDITDELLFSRLVLMKTFDHFRMEFNEKNKDNEVMYFIPDEAKMYYDFCIENLIRRGNPSSYGTVLESVFDYVVGELRKDGYLL